MIRFHDANIALGAPYIQSGAPVYDGAALRKLMAERGIAKALVWHHAQAGSSAQEGNDLLCGGIAGCDNLVGSLALLPPQTKETPFRAFLDRMRETGCRAIRLFPDPHHYLLQRVVFGKVLDELAERKIPVVIAIVRDIHGRFTGYETVYRFLADYPGITCIVANTGIWGADRYFRPLVETYRNVHIESSYVALTAGAVETFVRDCGPDRMVFGSGFPDRYIEASMMEVLHAGIPETAKVAIASGNLDRLLAAADFS